MIEEEKTLIQAVEDFNSGHKDKALRVFYDLADRLEKGPVAEKAATFLSQAQAHDPQVWNLLGVVLLNNRQLPEAGKAFAKAVALKSDYAQAWGNYGNVLHALGILKEAEQFFQNGLSCANEKEKKDIELNYLNVLCDLEKFDEALKILEKQIKKDPKNYRLYAALGNTKAKMQAPAEEVIDAFKKALEINPDHYMSLANISEVCWENGLFEGVDKYIKKSMDVYQDQYAHIQDQIFFRSYRDNYGRWRLHYGDFQEDDVHLKVGDFNHLKNEQGLSIRIVDKDEQIIQAHGKSVYPNTWDILDEKNIYLNLSFHVPNGKSGLIDCYSHKKECLLRPNKKTAEWTGQYILLGGAENYYHWIFDYLTRFKILEKTSEYDRWPIIVNSNLAEFQKESLKILGVDLSRLRPLEEQTIYRIEEMVIPYFYGRPMDPKTNTPMWFENTINREVCEWLRQKYHKQMQPRSEFPKRIFLSRKNAKFRRITNEDAVFELARKKGFRIVENENLNFSDQIALYAGADAVMGAHGAGFTNMVFAPEGATSIELHPTDHLPTYYQRVADVMKQRHFSVSGEIIRSFKPLGPSFWDFEVDLKDVEAVLDQLPDN